MRPTRLVWFQVVLVLAFVVPALAEPVTTIRSNGPAANRVDIAVLGDGYTAADIASGKYAADVDAAVTGMFSDEPYREYQRYFNVHRIDVTSAESGADHPSRGILRNTALDAAYDCGGLQRLICVSISKTNNILTSSITSPTMREIVLVLVNDTEYGGSGGAVAVASVHAAAVEIVLHEIGHSFALLADEYDAQPPSCNNSIEPPEANVTRQTARTAIKWNVWIDPVTPVPTPGTTETPGLYEGAKYCPTGLYRPTYNSKMRSLDRPFGAINSEAHIKRVYNYVTPLESSLPAASSLSLAKGTRQPASVVVPQPLTHPLTVSWTVDGTPAGTGTSFELNTATLLPGNHTMAVTVVDPTAMVRNDPGQVLRASRAWTVTVTSSFSDYPIEAGKAIKAVHITELRARINAARSRCGASTLSFTDPDLATGVFVRAVHVTELRTALDGAYAACGRTAPTYTDQTLLGVPIKAVHVAELQQGVLAIE